MRGKANPLSWLLCILFLMATAHVEAAGRVVYVDADAAGANDGSSWRNAYMFLQDALADAKSAKKPVEIRVAHGIYKPDRGKNRTSGDRRSTFELINGVSLVGGFAGLGKPNPNARDIRSYEAILSGDLANNDISWNDLLEIKALQNYSLDEPNREDNSYHVVIGSGTDETAVVDGFTVASGYADYPLGGGGGIYIDAGSPTIANCTFTRNWAHESGGGMCCKNNSNPTLTNCTISRNWALYCGGMDNSASNPSLMSCTFTENFAHVHSGIIVELGYRPYSGMHNWRSSPTLTNCSFVNNFNVGMCNSQSNPTLISCTFEGNMGYYGGGMYNSESHLTLANCVFVGNSAENGAALSNYNSYPNLICCTLYGNRAQKGAIISGGYPTLINCIVWGNTFPQILASASISYSDIQGGWPGEGNMSADPSFVDADGEDDLLGTQDDDLRLLTGSLCADAGTNAALLPFIVTDIAGNARIINGVVDMGAYESLPSGPLVSAKTLVVPEGNTGTFTVALAESPTEVIQVVVSVHSGDPDIRVESGGLLTFDASSYSIPQVVTIAADEDGDNLNSTAQIRITAASGLTAVVTVTEADNEPDVGVLFVDDDTVGNDNGSNWTDAYNNLQNALSAAAASDGVEEIRVAQGVYRPDQGGSHTPGDRQAAFHLINGIALRGGFAGAHEVDPNVRNLEIYQTILSGDLNGNDVEFIDPCDLLEELSRAENSYHVVIGSGVDKSSVLDGFTITGGNADTYPHDDGGGIWNRYCSPTVMNCIFSKNSALYGGGMYNGIGHLTLVNCGFDRNHAKYGGGAMYNSSSNPTLTNCTFYNNSAYHYHGGGMYNSSSNATLTDCAFISNSASAGGGMYNKASNPILTNCIFASNSALNGYSAPGGAMYNDYNVYFIGNTPNFFGSSPILTNCIFTDNSARDGAGMYSDYSVPTLTNCMFIGNSATSFGGGMYDIGGQATLLNCTFAQNVAPSGSALAGVTNWVVHPSIFKLSNCILWDGSNEIWNGKNSIITITYSDVQGGWPGVGNIDADPLFADPDNGDYHLKSQAGRWDPNSKSWVLDDVTSPCIDAGDPNSPVAFEPFPNGGRIDMGAYGGTAEASKSPSGQHAKYGGGTGKPIDPYLIYTPEQMNTIGAEPNDWDKHFKLMADIDLSHYTGTDFNIIGNGLLPAFTGVFDGDGHTISNFIYTSTGKPCVGIFGYIDGPDARISNLVLIDPNVDGGTGIGVGSLVGWVETGTITNCSATDAAIAGKMYVGGLVGNNGGSITDCHASGKISGISHVGGLTGGSHGLGAEGGRYSRGNIERCYSSGSVTGLGLVGGLVGTNGTAVVMDSYSSCNVIGGNSAGGLVGENNGNVGNCYSYGTVDAEDMIGGLVGRNDGTIMASCSSASVQGREEVGGLVGYNSFHGQIDDCYALGDVLGQKYVGGLLGQNALTTSHGGGSFYGTVRTCYSVAAVAGDEHAGGLIGYDPGGGVHDSFWDTQTSGRRTSAGGAGKTTAQMNDPNTFIQAGWDFVNETENGTEDVWAMPEGGGYPVLWWQLSVLPELPAFSGGTGEPNDPYLVATADELSSIGQKPRLMVAHFKLVNDIDLAGVNFQTIASRWYPFRGVFDGNGHTISNFRYTSADASYVGLFRHVAGGQIRDLELIGPNVRVDKGDYHGCMVGYLDSGSISNCCVEAGSVTGQDEIGGLVGENTPSGSITSCSYSGSVAGRDDVGGLAGSNKGRVAYSYSQSSIKGRNAIGGLVGRAAPGEVINCYAQGDVAGQWYIGGLAGSNGAGTHNRYLGAIRKCYSTTAILGGSQSGGLLGADWGGEVRDCFWDTQASGRTTSYGGTGKTTAEMQTVSTFLQAGWDFSGETANGIEDNWWILEGRDYPRLWWETAGGGR